MSAPTPRPPDPSPSRSRRLADLVAEALEQPESARVAFIRAAASDDDLFAAEALSLVVAAAGAGGFLQRATISPAAHTNTAAIESAARAPTVESPGTSIGHYRLLQQIGEGGFGVVFMAEQREPVRRQVALKIIKLGMDTRAVVARFEAERQALALMDHPGIARVFDAGATESGRPYFVMELVRGDPIAVYCDRHNLSTRERLDLFTQVCRAVQHAHTKGIIHRDLKPGNVLVTVIDGKPVPKIIDFGIAKATSVGARLTDKTLFTEFRQVIGTPAYMSPEQADNAAADIDTRTDVYSLGVILYELLTGVTPFDPQRLHSAAWGEMQRIIREEDPPKPSTRLSTLGEQLTATAARRATEPGRLTSLIRGDLDWIVMRCLEKERTRRYQTAQALAEDVQHAIAGEAVSAAPPSTSYRIRKFTRRHRGAVITASLLLTALVMGIVGTTYGLLRARAERDMARAERKSAQSIAEFLQRTLSAVGPSVARGRDTAMLREVLDKAAARIEAGELSDNPAAEMRLRRTIGATYADIARFDESQSMLNRALELARAGAGGPDPTQSDLAVADVLHQTAGLKAMHLRRMAEAEPLYREEVELRRRHNAADHAELARAISGVAGTLEGQGKLSDALSLHRDVLDMQRRLARSADGSVRDDDEVADAMHNLAGCLDTSGKPAEAEPLYRESLAIRTRLFTGDHPNVAISKNNLAGVLTTLGRADDAAVLYREALDMRRRLHVGDHPEIFISLNNLAFSLRSTGRVAEAEAPLHEAIAMARRLYKGDHALLADTLDNLSILLTKLGRPADAEPHTREALEMRRRLYGPQSQQAIDSLVSLTAILMNQQRKADAEPLLRELLAGLDKLHAGDHPRKAGAMAHLARCVHDDRDPARRAEARDLARRAADMAGRTLPEGQAVRVRCEKTLADIEASNARDAADQAQPAK